MDKEFLGERRRALEEEYFSKLNRALLERLRSASARDAESGNARARDDIHDDASWDRLVTQER